MEHPVRCADAGPPGTAAIAGPPTSTDAVHDAPAAAACGPEFRRQSVPSVGSTELTDDGFDSALESPTAELHMEPLHAAGSAGDLQQLESDADYIGRAGTCHDRTGDMTRHPTFVFDQSPILPASRLLRAAALDDDEDGDGACMGAHPASGGVPVPVSALSMMTVADPGADE
ncbi:hypothetical protein IWQ56_004750, partial [Coemansia nantahalensis]